MAAPLKALIELWPGEAQLFIRELPGFQITAPNPEEALIEAREALPIYVEWLRSLELPVPVDADDTIELGEERSAIDEIGPIFAADSAVPTEAEIELALAVGRAAISTLVDLHDEAVEDGTEDSLTWTLLHLAEKDRQYAGSMGATVSDARATVLIDDLIAAAGDFEDAADEVSARGTSVETDSDGEDWTLAKTLRRRTGHVREHLISLLTQPE